MSEVGVIPEEWEVKKLGEIASGIASGKSKLKSSTGIYPVYGSTGIIGSYDFYDYEGKKILVARVGANAGTINIVEGKYCVSDNTLIIQFNQNMDILFFYYLLSNCKLNTLVFGSGQPLITGSQLKDLSIFLPPLPEQQAIASALSDVDALITALEQLITKKRNIKQGAMQQILTGKKRLPGFGGGWEVKELKTVVNDFIVPMRDKPKSFKGDIPWCRIEDFDGKYLIGTKSGQYVNDGIVKEMNLKIHPLGTLLVSCSADLGRCAIVKRPLTTNQTFIGLVINELKLSNEFLYYYMTFNAEELNNLSSGTTISYLPREQFEIFKIHIPPLPEQKAIAQILSDMDTEIESLEQKQAKYKAIKQGMMQEILTGKRRLA